MNLQTIPILDRDNSFVCFSKALTSCKRGCLCNSNGKSIINNDVWIRSQLKYINNLNIHRTTLGEHDDYLKHQIFLQLSKFKIESTSKKCPLVFKVDMDISEEETSTFELCESCYVQFERGNHGKSFKTFQNWKNEIKTDMCVDSWTASAKIILDKYCKDKAPQAKYENMKEARIALGHLGLTEEQLQLACVPDTPQARQAYLWLYDFIGLVGDSAPNRYQIIQLPKLYTQESVHRIFSFHVKSLYTGDEHKCLEISAFKKLWSNVFPNVTIAEHMHVCGKCHPCHWLYERLEKFRSRHDLELIRELVALHKIMITSQRAQYMHNRQLAQTYPDLYFSLICDGMSQDHCILPHLAYAAQATEVLKQKITGAKQHGISKTFYRSYPHVNSGANLACEVLLHEIEHRLDDCIKNDKMFPRHAFLQIDGGPENTAKTFYGLCEYLVQIGIFDTIEISRLPVGHTHEDIDALFGLLWRALQNKTIITPQQWKEMALTSFKSN